MAGELVRKQAAANRAAAEMADFKRMVLEALQDREFRSEFWRALATDARKSRQEHERRNPSGSLATAANTEQARALKLAQMGRQGG